MDLICLRKLSWEGMDWVLKGLRIDMESLASITSKDIAILKLIYKHKRMKSYLSYFSRELGLDFILKVPDPEFTWPVYLQGLLDCFEEFGLKSQILNKNGIDQRIKKALIKDNSLCNQLNLSFFRDNPGQIKRLILM